MTTTHEKMKTLTKLAIAVVLVVLNAEVPFATAAEEPAVTLKLKVSESSLNSMSDKFVDDLCKAATVIWAAEPSKENGDALATVCGVSIDRKRTKR